MIFFRFFSVIFFFFPLHAALSQIRIDITQGNIEPLRIALIPFSAIKKSEATLSNKISAIIGHDLERSGLFESVSSQSFPEKSLAINAIPKFSSWQPFRVQTLLHGTIEHQGGKKHRISFRLWDVFLQKQLEGFSYNFTSNNTRRIAHIIADHIYSTLTGEQGYFNSRIVYVAEREKRKKITKHLAIMDSDGFNRKIIVNDQGIPQTPRFSPLTSEIVYSRLYEKKSDVYWLDLLSGQQIQIRNKHRGLFFSPRFTPDNNHILVSRAFQGNTEIWEYGLATQNFRRLTFHPGIDVSASYSPEGDKIVFNSDRSGGLELYVMDPNGKNIKRISFEEGRYTSPVWSPRGDFIAFVKQLKGRFFLGIMTPDGENERIITEDYFIDSPDWAPNGRVLIFHTKSFAPAGKRSKKRIYTIDITGRGLYRIVTEGNASFPSWSRSNN